MRLSERSARGSLEEQLTIRRRSFRANRRQLLPVLFRGRMELADITSRMNDFGPIVEQMKVRYNLRVRRWRSSMSGCAWRVYHHDGNVVNWIESPYPKTPISLAIFLHEVGHHAIGFQTFKRRCEEEYHVWVWAINEMRKLGVDPDDRVRKRFELSM